MFWLDAGFWLLTSTVLDGEVLAALRVEAGDVRWVGS